MKRRALYFFSRQDEAEVSDALRGAFPDLRFIDGVRWPTRETPLADGIDRCTSPLVYLWPADVVPALPSIPWPPPGASTGAPAQFQGPSSGPVIQFERCTERDGELWMAQLAAFIEDPKSPLGQTITRILAFLKRRYACPLDCRHARTGELVRAGIRGYLVGRSLRASAAAARPRLVLAPGRDEYFVPVSRAS